MKKKIIIEKCFTDKPEALLNKLQISTAARSSISRSLVGTRGDFEVDNNHELFDI